MNIGWNILQFSKQYLFTKSPFFPISVKETDNHLRPNGESRCKVARISLIINEITGHYKDQHPCRKYSIHFSGHISVLPRFIPKKIKRIIVKGQEKTCPLMKYFPKEVDCGCFSTITHFGSFICNSHIFSPGASFAEPVNTPFSY